VDGTPGGKPVVRGLRNPISIRCLRGKNRCFAAELGRDHSDFAGGREKLIPIHDGDDWGYPCCTAKGQPFPDVMPPPACGAVMAESNSFAIGDTPFGFDFAPSGWPAPWGGAVILTLHGAIGSWTGARIVAIATDPATGMPLASSTIGDAPMGAIADFATGWDDTTNTHGRPADVTFAADGRLFVADDTAGEIFWVAPL
jgi:glucose/arabinose dehydrogenase